MPVLIAAVALVGTLCVVDLLLTYGVVRRLREHTAVLSAFSGLTPVNPDPIAGRTVAEFAATDVAGTPVTRDTLVDDALVAFLSPGCRPCAEVRSAFVRHAAEWPGGRKGALAVVVGHPEETAAYDVTGLAEVARVVVEAPGTGGVCDAFGVTTYPTLCLVGGDGRVTAAGPTMEALLAAFRRGSV
jgi:hypothetical protein